MAEVTAAGIVVKTQAEYFAEEQQLYLDIDPNWNLDPSTPDGLKIAHDAEVFSGLEQIAVLAYNSKDPNKASGLDLDVVCSLTGTVRNLGTFSTVTLTLTGTPTTVIPAGSRVESTADGSQWALDAEATIGGGGTITAAASCTERGATQADIGTITKIVDTVGGWTAANNPGVAVAGTDRQSDASLRLERSQQVGKPGSNQVDSLYGEIYAVEDVTRVRVYENDTDATDSNGLVEHSVAIIVFGGDDAEIAQAIYRKKTLGVKLHAAGTPVTVLVTSELYPDNAKEITFSRPVEVPITVDIEITGTGLPVDIEDLIADAIVDYAAGTLVDSDPGFGIGHSVPISKIYTPINTILAAYPYAYVSMLELNGNPSNVAIDFDEMSTWATGDITVTVVP